jgi:Fur family peroxide stress response transcriptional regulator
MINKRKAREQFKNICAAYHLRLTPQRTVLFETMLEAIDHPTAETVYQRVRKMLPHISYDTVNRTLLSFVEHGIIRLIQSRGSAKRFEPNLGPHHHFQCIKCNRIIDFEYEEYNRIKSPANLPKSMVILEKKVVLEGICSKCRM